MSEFDIELLTDFSNDDSHMYDIHNLEIELNIKAQGRTFSDMEMRIVLIGDEFVFIAEEDEYDEESVQYLYGPSANSHKKMISQMNFPLIVNGTKNFVLDIELDISGPLIDVMKNFPEYITNPKYKSSSEEFIIQIIADLIDIDGTTITGRLEKKVVNPRFLNK